jgi:hypothetical protein
VNRSTVLKWQADPAFPRDVERLRRRMLDQAVGKFAGSVSEIADGMIKLALDAASEGVKLAAQRSVVENLVAMSEFGEVKDRLSKLEARLEEGGQHGCRHEIVGAA